MKPLLLSFLTLISVQSFAQETTKPSVLLGFNLSSVVSFSDTPDRYTLFPTGNSGYYEDQTNNSFSNFFQLESEFRWDHLYLSTGIGIGQERINFNVINTINSGNSGVGGSQSSRTTYDLTMKENHTYLIASLEGGYLFNKPDNRFRLGLGLGVDFNTDLSTRILENTLVRTNTTTTYVSGGPNAGTTTNSSTAEFDNSTIQWMSVVGDSEVFWLMPKAGVSAYYSITERLTLSIKADTRFVFHRSKPGASLDLKIRYPISLGIYFKL